jgi:hypothetical protein
MYLGNVCYALLCYFMVCYVCMYVRMSSNVCAFVCLPVCFAMHVVHVMYVTHVMHVMQGMHVTHVMRVMHLTDGSSLSR